MCCIFTCCGWLIDLFQRLWTFTMSCFISSAVCCSLITASMSGVALGYNYSLAEYIDLKETNVSVYLKRGIFDDDIADDMSWRRSGHQPVGGHIGENNLVTGDSDVSTTLRSGRRLDDSIYESNDRNNFEGSLMRLTAKPPDPTPVEDTASSEVPMSEIIKPFQSGSVDQLKAIQSAINMRKAAAAGRRTTKKTQEIKSENDRQFSYLGQEGRRAMKIDVPPFERSSTFNSLRLAVPDDQINDPSKWLLPKLPPQAVPKHILYADDYEQPTLPSPVTPRAGPLRPTRPKLTDRIRSSTIKTFTPSRSAEPNLPKSIDEEMESFKDKILLDKFDSPSIKEEDFLKKLKINTKKTDEDYEDEIRGVPLRKKRNIGLINSNNNLHEKNIMDVRCIPINKFKPNINNNVIKIIKLNAINEKVKDYLQSIANINEERKEVTSSILTTLDSLSNSPMMKLLLTASVS